MKNALGVLTFVDLILSNLPLDRMILEVRNSSLILLNNFIIVIIVKIWSMNLKSSVMTIDSKANVCCVQFHPTNANLLAFGSAGNFKPNQKQY